MTIRPTPERLRPARRASDAGYPGSGTGTRLDRAPGPASSPERPFVLQWHITERCNLRCRHCYQESLASPDLPFTDLLSILEQFRELVDRLESESAPLPVRAHINVTGGEPMVRRDLFDLLEVLRAGKERFSFGILTNGTLIDESVARRLALLEPHFVQVSLEGTAPTNDAIRGRGAFVQTVGALQRLIREGVPTVISFTAHRDNFREFPEVARLARELGVVRVWSDRLIPCGGGLEMAGGSLDPDEAREFFETMYGARKAAESVFCRTEVSMSRALQFLVGGGTPYRCHAGESLITVQPNGDLYPCRRLPLRVGNLTETTLTDLYYGSELFRALRSHRASPGCQGCRFATDCRGGLRCLAYAVAGDPFRADPGCWLVEGSRAGRIGSAAS